MGEINPHLRNVPNCQHKLWDQLFIMSDFKLDIDSPFPKPTRDTFSTHPDKLEYPPVLTKYRYYGHYIRNLIEAACEMEEGDKRDALVIAIAKHMKKAYMAWNRDEVEDDVIAAHLDELSEGRIDFSKVKVHLPGGELGTPNPAGYSHAEKTLRSSEQPAGPHEQTRTSEKPGTTPKKPEREIAFYGKDTYAV